MERPEAQRGKLVTTHFVWKQANLRPSTQSRDAFKVPQINETVNARLEIADKSSPISSESPHFGAKSLAYNAYPYITSGLACSRRPRFRCPEVSKHQPTCRC